MSDRLRDKPFIWPSWIAPLIAGDRQCWWSAWYRARYFFAKRPDDGAEQLTQWKADHAAMVRERVASLGLPRTAIRVEDQNKLVVHGHSATISACPDILYEREGRVEIEDGKTGQPRDGDWWQVFLYCWLYMIAYGVHASGRVLYRDGSTREVRAEDVVAQGQRLLDAIATVSGETPPARVPSAGECSRCPIARCPDRIEAAEVEAETEVF